MFLMSGLTCIGCLDGYLATFKVLAHQLRVTLTNKYAITTVTNIILFQKYRKVICKTLDLVSERNFLTLNISKSLEEAY